MWKAKYSILIWGIGLGIYLHDRIIEWMKGTTFMGRIHGIDVGVILMIIGFLTLIVKYKSLRIRKGSLNIKSFCILSFIIILIIYFYIGYLMAINPNIMSLFGLIILIILLIIWLLFFILIYNFLNNIKDIKYLLQKVRYNLMKNKKF